MLTVCYLYYSLSPLGFSVPWGGLGDPVLQALAGQPPTVTTQCSIHNVMTSWGNKIIMPGISCHDALVLGHSSSVWTQYHVGDITHSDVSPLLYSRRAPSHPLPKRQYHLATLVAKLFYPDIMRFFCIVSTFCIMSSILCLFRFLLSQS